MRLRNRNFRRKQLKFWLKQRLRKREFLMMLRPKEKTSIIWPRLRDRHSWMRHWPILMSFMLSWNSQISMRVTGQLMMNSTLKKNLISEMSLTLEMILKISNLPTHLRIWTIPMWVPFGLESMISIKIKFQTLMSPSGWLP